MRVVLMPAGCSLACLVILVATASGQQDRPRPAQSESFPSYYGPLAVEEPRLLPLPPAGALPPVQQPQPRAAGAERATPAFPFRLTSAQTPVAPSPNKTPLRLAPRSQQSREAEGGVSRRAPHTTSGTLVTVAGSLSVVLGLFLVVAWLSRRFAPPGTALLPKEAVALLGRAPLAGRQQVQLVQIGNKLLLVALSPAGAQTLTEITAPAEVEHLVALCRRGRPGSSSAAFREVLSEIAGEPAGGFVATTRSSPRGGR